MNCFQIVSLTYWTQPTFADTLIPARCELLSDCIFDLLNTTPFLTACKCFRCELLSDCIFDLLNTTGVRRCLSPLPLWIAFRLYLWLIEHNLCWWLAYRSWLWIAFRLYLWLIEHNPTFADTLIPARCELLSDCIFDLLNTTLRGRKMANVELWIAFRLYLWLIEHNNRQCLFPWPPVVNCFQIVSLTYWTQQSLVGKHTI